VTALLGAGRRDESGAFTPGAGLAGGAIDAVLAFTAAARPTRGATLDRLAEVIGGSAEGDEGLGELARIGEALGRLSVAEDQALFDPAIVRGLEYYTGAVFEADLSLQTAAEGGETTRFGSIGGGGRYDDLVARFTGQRTPATGFSFGVSRLAAALAAAGAATQGRARGPVVVLALDGALMGEYFALASELRAAGLAAEVYLGASGMRAQMKYADRRLAPAAVILGGDELAAGTVTIKDLDLGRALAGRVADNQAWRADRPGQVTRPRADLVAEVRRIVEAAA
jgi:histidyl-tRNA synthetase